MSISPGRKPILQRKVGSPDPAIRIKRRTLKVVQPEPEPFGELAQQYADKGWSGVLPLPPKSKSHPPAGFTGNLGARPTQTQLDEWTETKSYGNIALRLPENVIGLDVDDYDQKHGGDSLADLERKLGKLPSTYSVDNRRDGVSATRLFRIPTGLAWKWPKGSGADIDLIRYGHRYVVAPYSVHPEGRQYRWVDPSNRLRPEEFVPSPDDLAELPDTWVTFLTNGEVASVEPPAAVDEEEWLERHGGGEMCVRVESALSGHLKALKEDQPGSRHDLATKGSQALAYLAAEGHSGVPEAFEMLGEAFVIAVEKDRGSRSTAEDEYARMRHGAIANAAARPQVDTDPCTSARGRDDGKGYEIVRLSEIKAEEVDWLWEAEDKFGTAGLVPLGELTLLVGREGIGKSTLAYQFAADISRGRARGKFYGVPRNIVVIATEDSVAHTIKPRLIAAGADVDRIAFMMGKDRVTGRTRSLELAMDFDLQNLEEVVERQDAALVLLDPLMSRVGAKVDTHKDAEVRGVLEPIKELAERKRCAVLGIMHVNKGVTSDPLTAIMGSKAFAAVARSILFVMQDPDDPSRLLFGQPKSNLGRSMVGVRTFEVVSRAVRVDELDLTTGAVKWGDTQDRSIRDAMSEANRTTTRRGPSLVDQAAEWLVDYLKQQPDMTATRKQIEADGATAGFTMKQFDAARRGRLLGQIHSERARNVHGESTWRYGAVRFGSKATKD